MDLTAESTQGRATPWTHTADLETAHYSHKRSSPPPSSSTGNSVKLKLPWCTTEESPNQPSAVYGTEQSSSYNMSGSSLSMNSSHVCQCCSAVFMLSSSLTIHMETFHKQSLPSPYPLASRLHGLASEVGDKIPCELGRFPAAVSDDSRERSALPSHNFVVKLEPPCSMEEDPQDDPSAVYSPEQHPLSDSPAGHSMLQPQNRSHVCQCCSASFVLFSSLELHMVIAHGETLHDLFALYSARNFYGMGYHCDSSNDSAGSYSHKTDGEGGGMDFLEDDDTSRTVPVKKSRNSVCDVCGMAFLQASDLQKHRVIHSFPKPYVCDICFKAFVQACQLKKHMVVHEDHKPFACDMCSKAYSRAGDLKKHKFSHSSQKPFVCEVCNKGFARAYHLKIHRSIHTGNKPFVCDICEKGFTRFPNLKKHKLIHLGKKPYVCDVCGKAFIQADGLKQHKLIHSGLKPFECDVCSKAFTRADDLKKHTKVHTGHKPFVCDVCSKAFSQSSALKNHKFTHTDDKPFVCDVCNKTFSWAVSLKRHKKGHSEEKTEEDSTE